MAVCIIGIEIGICVFIQFWYIINPIVPNLKSRKLISHIVFLNLSFLNT